MSLHAMIAEAKKRVLGLREQTENSSKVYRVRRVSFYGDLHVAELETCDGNTLRLDVDYLDILAKGDGSVKYAIGTNYSSEQHSCAAIITAWTEEGVTCFTAEYSETDRILILGPPG